MAEKAVRIALVQMPCDAAPKKNLRRALAHIAEAAKAGAHLVVLPELFLGPYFCQRRNDATAFDRAETVPGPTTQALSDAARSHGITLVGGSVFEKAGNKYYNTASV